VDGCEIPQLYIGFPPHAGEPVSAISLLELPAPIVIALSQRKVHRGNTRINLQPNYTWTVTIHLSRYDLSIWDVVLQR
jgi:beta-glucosidase